MKSRFGNTPYQPYGLPQAISTLWSVTSHTAHINRYTHTHNALACKVQGLHNAANTIAHSHCLAFTSTSLHKAKRTHRGRDFQKSVVVDSLALKYRHIFKRKCLFCRQNADGNGLAGAIVPPVQSLAETK